MTLNRIALLIGMVVISAPAYALDCAVPGTHATLALALVDCDGTGDTITLNCPAGNVCLLGGVDLSAKGGVTIQSAQFLAGGKGLVRISANNPLKVHNAADVVTLHGIDLLSKKNAIDIENSTVVITGSPEHLFGGATIPARYAIIENPGSTAIDAVGADLTLETVSVEDSGQGLLLADTTLNAYGIVVQRTTRAGTVSGASAVNFLFSDDTVFNYVFQNNEGFFLSDTSAMYLEHTVLAGNLRSHAGLMFQHLFDVQDDADLDGVNILAYDNDQRANPGADRPFDPLVGNTPGHIVEHATSEEITFDYSTFVYNECDLMFNFDPMGSSLMNFDHTYVHSSWGKVFSASGLVDCPLVSSTASYEWDSSVLIDPVAAGGFVCDPGFANLNLVPQTTALAPVVAGPAVTDPPGDWYLILVEQPVVATLPSAFPAVPSWTVDGAAADVGDADVGFHNPL